MTLLRPQNVPGSCSSSTPPCPRRRRPGSSRTETTRSWSTRTRRRCGRSRPRKGRAWALRESRNRVPAPRAGGGGSDTQTRRPPEKLAASGEPQWGAQPCQGRVSCSRAGWGVRGEGVGPPGAGGAGSCPPAGWPCELGHGALPGSLEEGGPRSSFPELPEEPRSGRSAQARGLQVGACAPCTDRGGAVLRPVPGL